MQRTPTREAMQLASRLLWPSIRGSVVARGMSQLGGARAVSAVSEDTGSVAALWWLPAALLSVSASLMVSSAWAEGTLGSAEVSGSRPSRPWTVLSLGTRQRVFFTYEKRIRWHVKSHVQHACSRHDAGWSMHAPACATCHSPCGLRISSPCEPARMLQVIALHACTCMIHHIHSQGQELSGKGF